MLASNTPHRKLTDIFKSYGFKTHPWFLRETITSENGLNNKKNYTNQDPIEPGTTPLDLVGWPLFKGYIGDGLPFISLPIEWSEQIFKANPRTKNYFKFNNLFLKNDPIINDCESYQLQKGSNMCVGFIGAQNTGRSFLVVSHALLQNRPVLDMGGITDFVLQKLQIEQILEYCLATPFNTIILFDLSSAKPKLRHLVDLIQNKGFPLNEHRQFVYIVEKEHQLPSSVPARLKLFFPGDNDDKLLVWKYHLPAKLFIEDSAFMKNFKTFSDRTTDFKALKLKDCDLTYDEYSKKETKMIRRYLDAEKSDRNSKVLLKLLIWNDAVLKSIKSDEDIVLEYPEREQWRREFPTLLNERFTERNIHAPKYISSFLHRIFPVGVLPEEAVESLVFSLKEYERELFDKSFALNLHSDATQKACGKILITTKEIRFQENLVVPAIFLSGNQRYSQKDYKQLISTVYEQQKNASAQTKLAEKMMKTIAAQQATIDRLSMSSSSGSQMISETITTSSTSTSLLSTVSTPISPTDSITTTTTTNVTQVVGPKCNLCKKKDVTDKYKASQKWKTRCTRCLSKARTFEANTKRKREQQENDYA